MKKEFIKARKNTYAFFTDEAPGLNSPIDGRPMRRVFETEPIEINGQSVMVRAQSWQCQTTMWTYQDEWQTHCTLEAAKKAVATGGEVVYYHTKAKLK